MKKKTIRIPTLTPSSQDCLVEHGDATRYLPETAAAGDEPASKTIRPGRPVKRIVRAVFHELGLVRHRY